MAWTGRRSHGCGTSLRAAPAAPEAGHAHGLCHTFADELRAARLDVVQISNLLGHSSIAVTSRYLDHLTNHQAVTALEGVELPALGK
jgi:integrase